MSPREFITNLGDGAGKFFDVSPATVKKWLKSGSIPLKATEKIFAAMSAAGAMSAPQQSTVQSQATTVSSDGVVMPVRRKIIPPGKPPLIEIDPLEASFMSMTRPGRAPRAPGAPIVVVEKGTGKQFIVAKPKVRQAPIKLPPGSKRPGSQWTKTQVVEEPAGQEVKDGSQTPAEKLP